jgi:hypothetical protein
MDRGARRARWALVVLLAWGVAMILVEVAR